MIKKILFLLLLVNSLFLAQTIIHKGNIYYLSNVLIVKYKEGVSATQNSLQQSLVKATNAQIKISKQLYSTGLLKGEESLSRIYQIEYTSPEDPANLAVKISKLPEVEYAEPRYVHHVTYTPNDSLYNLSMQTNLSKILANQAWSISKGSSSIIIGIVDTGVDWTHPDLAAHIVSGIDLGGLNGTQDNDPSEDATPSQYGRQAYHGTHVAGIASAVSDNKIGIASIGFNCSLMPVKVSRGDVRDDKGVPLIYYGFDGIKYAADHGAKIINCSWGGYANSRYEQDIINYATSKGALVVAAQGNDASTSSFYPADYKNVLSVCWADNNDSPNAKANYGKDIDVMAPGTLVLSTWPKIARGITNDYNSNLSGSSMAAPLVSGLAGLVAAKFTNYTPQQIAEQIRVTCDSVASTTDLTYMLGKGRINAYRALNETNKISVRATDVLYSGGTNGLFIEGADVNAKVTLKNFLNSVSGLNISVQCFDSFIKVTQVNNATISMAAGDTSSNKFSFSFKIRNEAPYDYDLNFLIKFSAGNYSDFQWLTVRINPTYANHNSNKITMSITSKGNLAFTDFPENLYGSGFRFNGGNNLLFEGAFMCGVSSSLVMDAAREENAQSTDFNILSPINVSLDQNGNQVGETTFNDSGAAPNSLGIETKQKSYSFINSPDDKYVIIVDELKNKTSKDINNVYAGFYFDWDLPADTTDIDSTAFDQTEKFAYAFCNDKTKVSIIVGSALISSTNYGYYPVDNNASTGSVILNDGFTDDEKWLTLSSGVVNAKLGYTDISYVISGGPFNIPAGSSAKAAFVVAAAENIADLRNAIHQSRIKYQNSILTEKNKEEEIPAEFSLSQNYPNPFNPTTVINYQLSTSSHVTLKVYDVLGREVATLVNEFKQPGKYSVNFNIGNQERSSRFASAVYFYTLRADNFSSTKKNDFNKVKSCSRFHIIKNR